MTITFILIFLMLTPLVFDQGDNEKSYLSTSPSISSYFGEHPQEEKKSQFHRIFVGCLQTTLPNLCKKRSFGFKPGVKRPHLGNTTALKPSMEQNLFVPTIDHCENNNLTKISLTPSCNQTYFRDKNEMFDHGGLR